MPNTFLSHTMDATIQHGEYGFLLPAGAKVLSVTRNGVPVYYSLEGTPSNPRVSEPRIGAGWANGVITIELAG